jgi:hypothetical protein
MKIVLLANPKWPWTVILTKQSSFELCKGQWIHISFSWYYWLDTSLSLES